MRFTSRMASPTSRAARYMFGTLNRFAFSGSSSAAASCSLSMETTDCVTARLPAASNTMTRSPGFFQ